MPVNFIRGDTKRCNGPLHFGEYIPLSEFYYHSHGKRKGKPFSRCKRCYNYARNVKYEPKSVEYSKVQFVFEELMYRLGKMEACRRIGVSQGYFSRRKLEKYRYCHRAVVERAMKELAKCRATGEARHKKSIKHGAAMRGREERTPIRHQDFNGKNENGNYYRAQREKRTKQGSLTAV